MRLLHPAGCATILLRSSCGTVHLAGCATSRRHHNRAAAVPGSVAGRGQSICGQELQWAKLVSSELGCCFCRDLGANWVVSHQLKLSWPSHASSSLHTCTAAEHCAALQVLHHQAPKMCCWAQGSSCVVLGSSQIKLQQGACLRAAEARRSALAMLDSWFMSSNLQGHDSGVCPHAGGIDC